MLDELNAALCAILAARETTTSFRVNREGVSGKLTAYTSAHTHSSVAKAIKIAGVGEEQLRLVEVDGDYAMRPEALAERIRSDREKGYTPFFVCATLGTTSWVSTRAFIVSNPSTRTACSGECTAAPIPK